MKLRFLAMAMALLAASAPAATVTYQSWYFTGSTNNRPITIRLVSQGVMNGANAVFGTPLVCQPSSGVVTTNLLPANYTLQVGGVSTLYPFSVPDSVNTYNVWDLVTRGIYVWAPTNAVQAVTVGTNLLASTNASGVVTAYGQTDTNVVNILAAAAGGGAGNGNSTNFWGQLSPTNYNAGTGAGAATYLNGLGTWTTPEGTFDPWAVQLGDGDLTNWAAIATSAKADTWKAQFGSVQLTNLTAMVMDLSSLNLVFTNSSGASQAQSLTFDPATEGFQFSGYAVKSVNGFEGGLTGNVTGNASGTAAWATVGAVGATRATNFVGQLSPTNFNSGTGASGSTYLSGAGTWTTPGTVGLQYGSPSLTNLSAQSWTFSSPSAGHFLRYSGSVWTNGPLGVTAPLSLSAWGAISMSQAGVGADGWLGSGDWNTFNAKPSSADLTASTNANWITSKPAAADLAASTNAAWITSKASLTDATNAALSLIARDNAWSGSNYFSDLNVGVLTMDTNIINVTNGVVMTDSIGNTAKWTTNLVYGTALPVTGITASGTPGATTYLRGDGSWATPGTGSGHTNLADQGVILVVTNALAASHLEVSGNQTNLGTLTVGGGTPKIQLTNGTGWFQMNLTVDGAITGNGSGLTNVLSAIATNDNRGFWLNNPAPTSLATPSMYHFTVGYTNQGSLNFATNGFFVEAWDTGATNSGTYSYPFVVNLNNAACFRISKHGHTYFGGQVVLDSTSAPVIKFNTQGLQLEPNRNDSSVVYDGITYKSIRTSTTSAGNAVISGADASYGGTDASPQGGLTIAGGRSTGTGTPGFIQISTGLKTNVSGTIYNGQSVRYRPGESVTALTDDTATKFCMIGCNTNKYIGGTVTYTISASDGTDYQALSGIATFSAVNKGGVFTMSVTDPATSQASALSSGTLTNLMSITAADSPYNTTNIVLKASAGSSLTETSLNCKWQLHLNSDGYATVTAY